MNQDKLWIGGEWVSPKSGDTFATFNPTTGEEIARIPLAGKIEIDMAVQAARNAFEIWSQITQADRSKMILTVSNALRNNAAELTRLEILEHGTTAEMAERIPMIAAGMFEWAAGVAKSLQGDVIQTLPDVLTYLKREPVGVCGIITPWNHAILMMSVKLAQAITVGNTCILKPPSVNSLIALKYAEVLSLADLPKGVINVVTGPGSSVGNTLASHPGIDLIGFTGSSETGKELMAAGAGTMKHLIMELGGKNPVIVLDDADIDLAVNHHAPRQCDNAGQHCSGAGKFYIHKKVYNEFIKKYVEVTKSIAVGDPADKKTFMGPISNRGHRDRIENYIKTGVNEGAKLLLGGKRSDVPPMDKGFFVMPTVLADVDQNMVVARDEIFGPVSIIMKPFESDDEVLALANDNRYGLCSTVWTRDLNRALRFVNKLNSGTVNINTQVLTDDLPWGGFKESGIGKEGGIAGMKDYTQMKLVCLKHS